MIPPPKKSTHPNSEVCTTPNTHQLDIPPNKSTMAASLVDGMENSELMEEMAKQLRLGSNKDLSIMTTVIPDGAMKGRIVIEVQTKAGFRLLDLPPELRERIYGYVFAEPKEHQIEIYSTNFRRGRNRPPSVVTKPVCGPDFRSSNTHKGQQWDTDKAKWVGGPPSVLSLLLVDKYIHREATPIAYRTNRFIFKNDISSCVDRFVESIGPSAQYLGEVEVQKISSLDQLKRVLKALRNVTGLRRLYLPKRLVFFEAKAASKDIKNPESWACAFHKVIRLFLIELKKKYRASNRLWRVSDVVQFTKRPAWLNDGQYGADFQVFEAAFREIARAYLDEERE